MVHGSHQIFLLLLLCFVSLGKTQSTLNGECTAPDGRKGSCISLLRCPPMRALLVQVGTGKAPFSELRRNICLLGKEPYVCCVLDSNTVSPPRNPPPNPFPSNPPPSVPSSGEDLLPERCGVAGLTDRIIGGRPAPLGAWPWIVALNGRIGTRSVWHCGGTLISDRYVLTAAHCLDPRFGVSLQFVRVGEHTLGQDPDCTPFGKCAPSPQDIRAERTITHPSYNRPCRDCNDIALLRLERPVTFESRYVQPICLPLRPQKDMGFPIEAIQGKAGWAAGWGTISQDPNLVVRPDELLQVQLPIQRLATCNVLSRSYPDPDMILCAGGDGRDTCRGDSGGPFVVTNNVGSKYFLIGLTSKGPTVCGAKNTQGIYTAVHHYIPWILDNLDP